MIIIKIWAATWQNQQNGYGPAKTQISLGIRPVWSKSSLSAWRKLGSLITLWAHSEDSDQPGHPQRRLWSDWADAQADLSLRWAHTHFAGFVMSWLILMGIGVSNRYSDFTQSRHCNQTICIPTVWLGFILFSYMSHIMQKCVFRDFLPGKIQTILLSYRS